MIQIGQLQDIRPVLQLINSVNADDPYAGWCEHKSKVLPTEVEPKKNFMSWFRTQKPKAQNIFEFIEKIAKEERSLHESQMKVEMEHMMKMREEGEKKMLEEMKKKDFKMFDYLTKSA